MDMSNKNLNTTVNSKILTRSSSTSRQLFGDDGKNLFEIIQECNNAQDLELLMKAIHNVKEFKDEVNEEILKKTNLLKIHDAASEYKKNIRSEIGKLKKKALLYSGAVSTFNSMMANLRSPQEVDVITETIDVTKQLILGVGPDVAKASDPVQLEKSIAILERVIKNVQKESSSKLDMDRLMGLLSFQDFSSVNSPEKIATTERMPELIIKNAKGRIKERIQFKEKALLVCFERMSSADNVSTDVIRKRYEALNALRVSAESVKHNFDDRLNVSNGLYITSTVFYVTSMLSMIGRGIPGINFIAEPISKSADFLSYFFHSIAQAKDPNIPKEQVNQSNLQLKEYGIAESATGATGSLALLSAIVLGPIPLVVGTALLGVSSTIAVRNVGTELDYVKRQFISELDKELLKHTKYSENLLSRGRNNKLTTPEEKKIYSEAMKEEKGILANLKERGKLGTLKSKREKELYRDAMKISSLEHKYKSKAMSLFGSAFLMNAAILLLVVASISFPPAGLAIAATAILTFTVLAVSSSLMSAREFKKQHNSDKLSRAMAKEIDEDEIHEAIQTIKKEGNLIPAPDIQSKEPRITFGVDLKKRLDSSSKKRKQPSPELEVENSADILQEEPPKAKQKREQDSSLDKSLDILTETKSVAETSPNHKGLESAGYIPFYKGAQQHTLTHKDDKSSDKPKGPTSPSPHPTNDRT